jgi:hypothetical protein
MADTSSDHTPGLGILETMPLAVGIVGISIPVGLIAWACITESVVLLVLAVIGVFLVGAATLTFIMRLASDEPDHADAAEHAVE